MSGKYPYWEMLMTAEDLLVTESGEVQNKITGNWLKGDVNNSGYRRVTAFKKRWFVHRLVAEKFIPNPDGKRCVNHKNGDKTDNRVENLEWVTDSENQLHKCFVLNKTVGSKNSNSVLTEKQVIALRNRHANGESGRSLARAYNISQTMVRNILSRKAWKHI